MAALLGGLLLLGAAAGATSVFSSRTQQSTETFTQDLARKLNATGKVSAQQTSYQKGLTGSTQTMTVSIKPDESTPPIKLLVTNHIQHGPFPAFKSVGQAVIDTDIRFEDPKVQAQVDKALGGQKPTIHTLVGLGGDTHSTVTIPSGSFKDEQDATMSWKPLLGHVHVVGNNTTTDMQWDGLTMQGKDGGGEITGLSLQGSQQKASPESLLATGNATFKIDRMKFNGSSRGKQDMELNHLETTSETNVSPDKFADIVIKYNVGEFKTGGQSLKNMQLHLGFRHLSAAPLERIAKVFNEMQNEEEQKASGNAKPDLTEAQTKQLQDDALALLKGQPKITLDRLSITQPSGDIVLTGEASAPKLATMSAEDLAMAAQMPAMLASAFELHLEGKAKEKALSELSSLGGGRTQGLEGSIQPMLEQGYLTKEGDELHMVFDYKEGQSTLNGKPLGR